ncbi:hypothetical protein ACJMK2_005646 [Sinanodonta woodiana]|uniref:Peptidase M12B domain-containing protein n=1 Tax=Sinanodonta woodiana TaxID=1069815 RepID=A0ABD3VRE1_SINWO
MDSVLPYAATFNMRVDLIILAVSMAASLPFEKTDSTIHVGVREVHVENEGFRARRGTEMPRKKKFEIDLKGDTVTLDLTLNELVKGDAPVYVVEGDELKKWEQENTDEQYGFYQDQHMQASIMVRCSKGICRPIGSFTTRGQRYHLSLDGEPIESSSLLSPVKEQPILNISRQNDMVIVTETVSNDDDKNENLVPNARTLMSTLVPEMNDSQQDSRKKRAIPVGTDIVELMVYVDDAICSSFMALSNDNRNAAIVTMRAYYALLVNEMDSVFKPFKNHPHNTAGLDIRLFYSGIVTSCSSSVIGWSTKGKNSRADLYNFAEWQEEKKNTSGLKYDIAMGISGRIKGIELGIAYVGSICKALYGSLVVYQCDWSTFLMTTAVHELVHNLGARHDQPSGCTGTYLMNEYASTGTEATAQTQYEFSSCSVQQIQTKISSLGSDRCTLKHNFNDTRYDALRARAIGGEKFSLEFQCQLFFGPTSYACSVNSSTMCYSGVYCQTSTGCDGRMQLVKEHTTCDDLKWCVKGQCVNINEGRVETPDSCVIYSTCKRRNKQLEGDGCCQGSVTTDCCMLGERQSSCSMEVPCS